MNSRWTTAALLDQARMLRVRLDRPLFTAERSEQPALAALTEVVSEVTDILIELGMRLGAAENRLNG